MADHAKPILTDNYTDVLSQIRGRLEDQAKGFDPANTTATNISTGTIRWNSAEKKFQKWSGTAWGDLTDNYVLSGATFSTGTANGVAYLNGSKVLTTGSALTFDGTALQVSTASGGNVVLNSTVAGTVNTITSLLNNGNAYADIRYNALTHQWLVGTEQMRLTSTGLGIGTSSPGYKLDVAGTARIGTAIFDTSGNLGLGVTPSAWGGGYGPVLEMKAGGSLVNNQSNNVHVANNCYYNGTNWIYKSTNPASRYEQFNGLHAWQIAPSGTAGNPISFTQAMTLDANGKLILSAANQGIQFADGTTQTSASFAGSYEPVVGATTSNFTGTREGLFYYTKVGNIVTVTGRFSVTKQVASIASGDITITVPVSGRNTFAPVRGVLTTEASTYVSASPAYYGIPVKLIIGTSTGSTVNIRVDAVAGYQFSSWFVDVSFSYPLI